MTGGGSWPTVGVKPLNCTEHAIQLIDDARKLLAHAQDLTTARKQVPWNIIEPFITSVQELAGKTKDQPSIKEVMTEIAAIKAFNKSIDDKVTVVKNTINGNPTRFSKEPAVVPQYSLLNSWAKIAASRTGPTPSTITVPSSTPGQPGRQIEVSLQKDCEITVKLSETAMIQHWRGQSSDSMVSRVNNALANAHDQNIAALKICSAKQLKSGNILIYAANAKEAETL